MDKRCIKCEFYENCQCKRFPPSIKKPGNIVCSHNEVDGNDWCGEFRAKECEKPVVLETKKRK